MKSNPSAFQKGFFFTVIAVILLTFIIASIAAWSKVVSTREAKVAENFRLMTLKTTLDAAGETAVTSFSQKALYYAVWKVDNRSSCIGISDPNYGPPGNPNPYTGLVSRYMSELFVNGSTSDRLVPSLDYSSDEMQYALSNFSQLLNSSTSKAGISIWLENPRNISIRQTDAWTVSLDYNVTLAAQATDGSMSLRRNLAVRTNVSIEGFVDPLISRGDRNLRNVDCSVSAKRQIFRNGLYQYPYDLAPISIANDSPRRPNPRAVEGKGWLYGNKTNDKVSDIMANPGPVPFNPASFMQTILEADYYENITLDAPFYAGLIITTAPEENITETTNGACTIRTTRQEKCVDCFITVESLNYTTPGCPGYPSDPIISRDIYDRVEIPYIVLERRPSGYEETNPDTPFALFDNENDEARDKMDGYHRLYDIGRLRDATVCGYFVENPDLPGFSGSPSFFQRMLSGGEGFESQFGIQTFVIGTWAGGADDPHRDITDRYSRVDHKFYSRAAADSEGKIKGMPGCKNVVMCDDGNTNTTTKGVGRFRLDRESMGDYRAGIISCNTTGARCEN